MPLSKHTIIARLQTTFVNKHVARHCTTTEFMSINCAGGARSAFGSVFQICFFGGPPLLAKKTIVRCTFGSFDVYEFFPVRL